MRQKCSFNKMTDIVAFRPGCAPDLNLAISTGIVPDSSSDNLYNSMEIDDVGHRIEDSFDVLEYDKAYSRLKAKIEAKRAESKAKK